MNNLIQIPQAQEVRRLRVEQLWDYARSVEIGAYIRLKGAWLRRVFRPHSEVEVTVDYERHELSIRQVPP